MTVQHPLVAIEQIVAKMLLDLIEWRPFRQEHAGLPASLGVRFSCMSPVLPRE
jgi:hypothetical protein